MRQAWFTRLLLFTSLLAFILILMGAYLRLSDAGLVCPDFPGCDGQLFPADTDVLAWSTMIHRYVAFVFSLFVVSLVIIVERMKSGPRYSSQLRLVLLLTFFQGWLGYLTISMLLHPAVVTLHLLTAMLILSLLWSVYLNAASTGAIYSERLPRINLRPWTIIAFFLVCVQILVGGFTSSNYVSLACPDLPTCQQQWLPAFDFSGIYHLLTQENVSYQDGLLNNEQSISVHLLHRYGAVITAVYILLLSLMATRKNAAVYRNAGLWLVFILILQMQLGVANILLLLPLPVALAHTGGAVLLLLSLVYLHHLTRRSKVSIYTH
jgi:cytochrome c oxidase assembly protein subunit 15